MTTQYRPNVLYVDSDESYCFIVSEILKNEATVYCAQDAASAVNALTFKPHVDVIFLCVDHMDHATIINGAFHDLNEIPPVVLISKTLDTISMCNLMTSYGALNYLMKPFSKEAFEHLFYGLQTKNNTVFRQRLFYDIQWINHSIQHINEAYDPVVPIPRMGLTSFDHQVHDLRAIKTLLEPYYSFPKAKRPNILFVDDETNIIQTYRDHVKMKPFHSFFSKNLNDAMAQLKSCQIDLVLLDLGLPDGHGISLLDELYGQLCTDPALPDVIVLSSFFDKDTVVDVINAGARAFVNKPVTLNKVLSMMYQVIFFRYIKQEFSQWAPSSTAA